MFTHSAPFITTGAEHTQAAAAAAIAMRWSLNLEHTPPELAQDIIHAGIYLTGGSSQIHGLDQLFSQITGIKVNTCDAPEESVARGLVKLVSDSKFKHLAYTLRAKVYK